MADVRLTAINPEDSSVVPVACNAEGRLKLEEPLVVEGPPGEKGDKGDPGDPFSGNFADDVTFAGRARIEGDAIVSAPLEGQITLFSRGHIQTYRGTNTAHHSLLELRSNVGGSLLTQAQVFADGRAVFSGNKAGFTAEGYLWCTTRRGDTVMLDATSNGMASWVIYTPPNRLTELQDKWSEKDGILPVPHESSQDEPEITQ